MKLAVALAAFLLLAGCLDGSEDPVETASAPGSDPPPVPTASAGSATSGSPPSSPPSASPAGATPPDATAPVRSSLPFTAEGLLAARACAVAVCARPPNDRVAWIPVDLPGTLVQTDLTLTWTPSSAMTAELRFVVAKVHSCGENCIEGAPAIPAVTGPSPLALSGSLPPLGDGEFFEVSAWVLSATPDPVFVLAHPDQEFTIEGTFVSET